MGRYGAENGSAKAAGHFSRLIDGKLPWLYRVTQYFGWWTQSLNLMGGGAPYPVLGVGQHGVGWHAGGRAAWGGMACMG